MLNNEFDNLFSRKFDTLHEQVDPGPSDWTNLSQRLDRRDNRNSMLKTAALATALLLLGANLWSLATKGTSTQQTQTKTVFIYDTIIKRSTVYDTIFRKVVVRTPIHSLTNTAVSSNLNPALNQNTLIPPQQNTLFSFNQNHQNTLFPFNQNTLHQSPNQNDPTGLMLPETEASTNLEKLIPVGSLAITDISKRTVTQQDKNWPVIQDDKVPMAVTKKVENKGFRLNSIGLSIADDGEPKILDPEYFDVKSTTVSLEADLYKNIKSRFYVNHIKGSLQSNHNDGLAGMLIPPPTNPSSLFKYWELVNFNAIGYGLDIMYQYPTRFFIEPYIGLGINGSVMLPSYIEFEYTSLDPVPVVDEIYIHFPSQLRFGALSGFAGLNLRVSPHIHFLVEGNFARRMSAKKAIFYENMNQLRFGLAYKF